MVSAKANRAARLALVYLSLVALSLTIGFVGDQSPLFLLAAFFLTLPWSATLDSYGFALVHGAADYRVAWYFVAFAAVNALIIYLIGKVIGRFWR